MEPENLNEVTEEVVKTSELHKVTPLSKYLAIALFVTLPFVGGWIGYNYAPEKVVLSPVSENENIVGTTPKEINISIKNAGTVEQPLQTGENLEISWEGCGSDINLNLAQYAENNPHKLESISMAKSLDTNNFVYEIDSSVRSNTYRVWVSSAECRVGEFSEVIHVENTDDQEKVEISEVNWVIEKTNPEITNSENFEMYKESKVEEEEVGIIIISPAPNDLVKLPITVTGSIFGNGWLGNEGEVGNAEVFDANDKSISSSAILTATSNWLVLPTEFEAVVGDRQMMSYIETNTGYIKLTNKRVKEDDLVQELIIPVRFK